MGRYGTDGFDGRLKARGGSKSVSRKAPLDGRCAPGCQKVARPLGRGFSKTVLHCVIVSLRQKPKRAPLSKPRSLAAELADRPSLRSGAAVRLRGWLSDTVVRRAQPRTDKERRTVGWHRRWQASHRAAETFAISIQCWAQGTGPKDRCHIIEEGCNPLISRSSHRPPPLYAGKSRALAIGEGVPRFSRAPASRTPGSVLLDPAGSFDLWPRNLTQKREPAGRGQRAQAWRRE
jgi:hypothetical protein